MARRAFNPLTLYRRYRSEKRRRAFHNLMVDMDEREPEPVQFFNARNPMRGAVEKRLHG